MKLTVKKFVAGIIFLLLSFLCVPLQAQEPPHPPGSGHGQQGNQNPGGTAPIDGGIVFLMVFAAGYATIKQKQTPEENSVDIIQ